MNECTFYAYIELSKKQIRKSVSVDIYYWPKLFRHADGYSSVCSVCTVHIDTGVRAQLYLCVCVWRAHTQNYRYNLINWRSHSGAYCYLLISSHRVEPIANIDPSYWSLHHPTTNPNVPFLNEQLGIHEFGMALNWELMFFIGYFSNCVAKCHSCPKYIYIYVIQFVANEVSAIRFAGYLLYIVTASEFRSEIIELSLEQTNSNWSRPINLAIGIGGADELCAQHPHLAKQPEIPDSCK